MKKICLFFVAALFTAPLFSQKLAAITFHSSLSSLHMAAGSFSWNATTFDFGKIKVNTPVTHEFHFTNSGNAPLVISSVQASCGCTVTDYSKDPIAPGSEGYVKATYNAAKVGTFSKTVTVNANAEEGIVQLTIKGEVVE
jgi:hypothetical protein